MKALKKKTKIILIVAVVVALLLVAVTIIWMPSLIQPLLWTLLILGVGFFALELWSRRTKRNKQKKFDEKVSAKEGIEDRKREWAGWIEELERQGIDRYELPFYMIVGEPQSGKSVLLQNSDLYFPFGQERLSGVGGTRGCDWWFTDEAVILDIAGRLFTHEGGVADKLEWEAFLDQLNAFRPLCPANGVLLVIPCDALLEDSPETCADKANKIQSALLTLTQKLQAKLPVYLVLTKGDRVFGFAESVHRLDPEQRHQMFGWSRDPDMAEKPFALDEAKTGFARLVDRARLLRERMIASARLPEALPEIDRLYAFPDELAGMYKSLEIYLKRIFTESNLVDRAAFRGIYLSSGLQTGAPVARVCAELLGDNRDSDARALESLFSHQRAYFIKDLMRNRVFAERGLVRPTEGRVLAARRNAMIGYGAAGLLAVAAVIGSVVHLLGNRASDVEQTFAAALEAGRRSVGRTEILPLLRDLHEVDLAAGVDRELMHEVFSSTRDSFEDLYRKICARSLVPALRRGLLASLSERAMAEPTSSEQVMQLIEAAPVLFDQIDFGDRKAQDLIQKWLPADWMVRVIDAKGAQVEWTVGKALSRHGGDLTSPLTDRPGLEKFARRLLVLMDRLIDPATPWMLRGHLGYMAAWKGAMEAQAQVRPAAERRLPDLLQQCDIFANSIANMKAMEKGPALGGGEVINLEYRNERQRLGMKWDGLTQFVDPAKTDAKWQRLAELDGFAVPMFAKYPSQEQMPRLAIFSGGVFGRLSDKWQQDGLGNTFARIPVPPGEVELWSKGGDFDACDAPPKAQWTLRSVAGALRQNHNRLGDIYNAKVIVMTRQFAERFPNWAAAREDFHRDAAAPPSGDLDQALVAALASIRRDLGLYQLSDTPGALHVSNLLAEHLRAVDAAWQQRAEWGTTIDWSVATSLIRLAAEPAVGALVTGLGNQLCWQYLGRHETRLLREWTERPDSAAQTLVLLAALNEHLGKLGELEIANGPDQPIQLINPEHQQWLRDVDEELVGRIDKHLEALRDYWRPKTTSWLDLRAAVENTKEALTAQAVRKKILDAKKSVDAPDVSAGELRPGQPISTTTLLPLSTKALTALRGFTVPSETDVRNHPMAVELRTLTGQIEQLLTTGSSKSLTGAALQLEPLPVEPPDMTTVDHYLRPLYEAMRDRLVGEVRGRYVRALAEAVQNRGSALLSALYANGPAEINVVDDQEVIRRLGLLLDPEGQLDSLRRDYGMIVDANDAAKPNLRPGDGFAPPAIDAGWWAFEGFLGGLQKFLLAGEGKVADAVFKVRYELPRRAGGVWDIDLTKKQFCYYATNSGGKGAPGFTSYGDQWGLMEKPLEWLFQIGKRPSMWLVWTHKLRTQSFQWPADKLPGDLAYELTGCLAPLQLAWSGVEDAGWWQVQFEPADTTEKARLRLSFQAVDGADLTLPKRPARPTPF